MGGSRGVWEERGAVGRIVRIERLELRVMRCGRAAARSMERRSLRPRWVMPVQESKQGLKKGLRRLIVCALLSPSLVAPAPCSACPWCRQKRVLREGGQLSRLKTFEGVEVSKCQPHRDLALLPLLLLG